MNPLSPVNSMLILALCLLVSPTCADEPTGPSTAKDSHSIQGTWTCESAEGLGVSRSKRVRVVVAEKTIAIRVDNKVVVEANYALAPQQNPPTIDLQAEGQSTLGIYELKGTTLRLCFGSGKKRPVAFLGSESDMLLVLTRQKTPAADPADTAAVHDPIMDRIVSAWNYRQNRTRSARFVWKEIRVHSGDFELGQLGPKEAKRLKTMPSTTREQEISVSFDGDMLRYTRNGPQWISQLKKYLPRTYISVSDADVAKAFYGGDASGQKRFSAVGFVDRGPRHPDSSDTTILAILATYRPFNEDLGRFDPKQYSVSTVKANVENHSCIIVEERTATGGGPDSYRTYCLDPERDYVILRLQSRFHGELAFNLDISYSKDQTHGWVPAGWTGAAFFSSGKTGFQFTSKVIRYEINPKIPRSEFQLEFPAGAAVTDRRSR